MKTQNAFTKILTLAVALVGLHGSPAKAQDTQSTGRKTSLLDFAKETGFFVTTFDKNDAAFAEGDLYQRTGELKDSVNGFRLNMNCRTRSVNGTETVHIANLVDAQGEYLTFWLGHDNCHYLRRLAASRAIDSNNPVSVLWKVNGTLRSIEMVEISTGHDNRSVYSHQVNSRVLELQNDLEEMEYERQRLEERNSRVVYQNARMIIPSSYVVYRSSRVTICIGTSTFKRIRNVIVVRTPKCE